MRIQLSSRLPKHKRFFALERVGDKSLKRESLERFSRPNEVEGEALCCDSRALAFCTSFRLCERAVGEEKGQRTIKISRECVESIVAPNCDSISARSSLSSKQISDAHNKIEAKLCHHFNFRCSKELTGWWPTFGNGNSEYFYSR
jgi:hypothetical protein